MFPADAPVLTAAQMRAAEQRAAPGAEAMYALMERAGAGVADYVWRLAAGHEILVACGPGNNGGDGYVAARILARRGARVRVAASAEPRSDLARRARAGWRGPVESLDHDSLHFARAAPIFVDAVFGAGQSRPIGDDLFEALLDLTRAARVRIAVDLPSGVPTDEGGVLVREPLPIDHTLAIGALKPAHVAPSEWTCGEVHLIDIGLDLAAAAARTVGRPAIARPGHDMHKYTRGMVGIVAGEMPGAAVLAATAAARAGAGYVVIFGEVEGGPASIVRRPLTDDALADDRLDVVLIGPGLGRSAAAREKLDRVLAYGGRTVVLDADALALIEPAMLDRNASTILTPHAGELWALRKRLGISHHGGLDLLTERTREWREIVPSHAHVVLVEKGSTTYIVRDEQIRVSPRGNPWLSTAGTGDVLAGAIAAMAAIYGKQGKSMVDAAAAGVWLHAEAARRLRASFVADDLAHALSAVRAAL